MFTGHKFKGHWQDGDRGRQTGKIFCQLTPNHKTLLWGEDVDTSPSNAKRIAVSDISSVDTTPSRDKIVINYSDQGVPKTLELDLEMRVRDKTLLLEYWADGLRYVGSFLPCCKV